ncbi:MAG: histidinol-phosphate transaminase [Chloroflexi bacterium]|nr:histidinol-phosphate transaminase [Chloroflexota bacterium]
MRPEVRAFVEYAAPEPVEAIAARYGFDPATVLKLDQNENPYGCSPRVQAALASFDQYHIYPDPLARATRTALAEYVGFPPAWIAFGNGSDELIELLLRLTLALGDRAIICTPTFAYYDTAIAAAGGVPLDIPRGDAFQVDVDAVLAAVDARTRVIFVASPNNPTGTVTPVEDVVRLLSAGALVVVDEAYHEFAGQTVAPLVRSHENLVVLRTFSKWAGLAGLRAGYGIMSPHLVSTIYRIKPPYSVNAAAEVAVRASLADRAHLAETIAAVRAERDRLGARLMDLLFLRPVPSAANFILCQLTRGDASLLRQRLEARGILVRYYRTDRLRNSIRFSVGRPEHNDRLLLAIGEIARQEGWL